VSSEKSRTVKRLAGADQPVEKIVEIVITACLK